MYPFISPCQSQMSIYTISSDDSLSNNSKESSTPESDGSISNQSDKTPPKRKSSIYDHVIIDVIDDDSSSLESEDIQKTNKVGFSHVDYAPQKYFKPTLSERLRYGFLCIGHFLHKEDVFKMLVVVALFYTFCLLAGFAMLHIEQPREFERRSEYLKTENKVAVEVADLCMNATERVVCIDKIIETARTLHELHQTAGLYTNPDQIVWTFNTAYYYVLTTITTIGYGSPAAKSLYGRVFTLGLFFIGIPFAYVVLSMFGKLFIMTERLPLIGVAYLYQKVRNVVRRKLRSGCKKINSSPGGATEEPNQTLPGTLPSDLKNVSQNESEMSRIRRAKQKFTGWFRPNRRVEPSKSNKIAVTIIEPDDNILVTYSFLERENFSSSILVILINFSLLLCLGAFIVSKQCQWTYWKSFYFLTTTFSTVGFGDEMPSDGHTEFHITLLMVIGLSVCTQFISYFRKKTNRLFAKIFAKAPGLGRAMSGLYSKLSLLTLSRSDRILRRLNQEDLPQVNTYISHI